MRLLRLNRLSVGLAGRSVVRDVSFALAAGEFVGVIGPNGAGKTTMMRAALGLVPHAGTSSVAAMEAGPRARHAAWMPQERQIAWPVSAETLVALGRLPHGAGRRLLPADHAAMDRAFRRTGTAHLRDRIATQLSGGEQARLLLARLLAQEAPLLVADEPIAGLDPGAQIATMRLLGGLAADGRGVLVSLHDLGLALRHCSRLLLMDGGKVVADGVPAEVLGDDHLARVFGITAFRAETAHGPVFQPLATV